MRPSFFPILLLLLHLILERSRETEAINLFLSAQQANAFVADVKSKATDDALDGGTTSEEIGNSVKPGEVEKEIQEELIEDTDPQEATLENEENTREKTEL